MSQYFLQLNNFDIFQCSNCKKYRKATEYGCSGIFCIERGQSFTRCPECWNVAHEDEDHSPQCGTRMMSKPIDRNNVIHRASEALQIMADASIRVFRNDRIVHGSKLSHMTLSKWINYRFEKDNDLRISSPKSMFWRVLFGTPTMILFAIEFVGDTVRVRLLNKQCAPIDQVHTSKCTGVIEHFLVNTARTFDVIGLVDVCGSQ